MSEVPSELKYTKDHEWARIDGDTVTMGITDYAQGSLGDLVYVELPQVGREVKKGEVMVIVESCKAASDVYAPVSGTVIEINQSAVSTPETVNKLPYSDGWLVKLKPTAKDELESMLDANKYKELAA